MKKLSIKQLIIIVLVADIILCITAFLTISGKSNNPETETTVREISKPNIQKLCELTTLECYYHNVSDWSQSAYGLFGYGAKKVWIEYDGVVRVGIKAGQIKISDPDENDVITVTMPEATILDKDLDERSIKEISSDTPVLFFNDEVNTEDRKKALANAQEDMEASAAKNDMILGEAQERAKKIIERNIVALGEAGGKHYTVKFIDASE